MKNKRAFRRVFSLILLLLLPSFSFADVALDGETIFKKRCAGCHGVDGTSPAYGISRKLAEMTKSEMTEKLSSYTSKEILNSKGVTAVMGKQTAALSKKEYEEVLKYISSFAVK
ncbi:MAG: c-type cytochrome [Campylobacteraceae bacterium]|jgi:cytochrome c553|nr:c-type cytochrome [Campylobacteraceae bacterium]